MNSIHKKLESTDPYQAGLIPNDIYVERRTVLGEIVAVMNARLDNRGLLLIPQPTRAFRKHDLVELIATIETGGSDGFIQSIAYLGFVEISVGGIVQKGDAIQFGTQLIGVVQGFDATHMPNHYNLIVNVKEMQTGTELGLGLGNTITFYSQQYQK